MSSRPAGRVFAALFALSAAVAASSAHALDELVWRGDQTTARAVMNDLGKEYAKQKKGKIVVDAFSTVSGLDAVAQGKADIAGSARGKYARRGEEAALNFIPVALDAVVPITHPANPVSGITLKQIYDVYYGRIKNWKDLGGPDKPINLYAIAAPLDGVEFSLRELVFRNGDQRVAAPRLYINTTKLEEAITLDPAGLGLSTLSGVTGNKKIKMLGVEGTPASVATVSDGSYPLYITLYLAEREGSPKHDAVMRLLTFLETPPAKAILKKHDLVPYSDASAAVAKHDARMAMIDAKVGRDANAVAAMPATAPPPPVSAPRATVEAANRIAPTSQTAQSARDNLARAEAKKPAATAAKPAAPKAVAAKAVASAPKKAVAPAKPKAAAPAKKPAAAAPAAAKASFDNVGGGAAKPGG